MFKKSLENENWPQFSNDYFSIWKHILNWRNKYAPKVKFFQPYIQYPVQARSSVEAVYPVSHFVCVTNKGQHYYSNNLRHNINVSQITWFPFGLHNYKTNVDIISSIRDLLSYLSRLNENAKKKTKKICKNWTVFSLLVWWRPNGHNFKVILLA